MIKGKIVFITGATSGIGYATAIKFAEEGARLILSGRREDRLIKMSTEIKEKYHVDVFTLVLDVQKRSTLSIMDRIPTEWQQIDILVNNAGLAAGMGPLHEGNPDDWDQMIDTNVKGLLWMSRAIIPGMVERKQGHIINIGSIAGKETYANGNVYCATKHAVDSLNKAMRIELVNYGIRVTLIAPGAAETEFSEVRFKGNKEMAKKVYEGYMPLQADDVADAIYYVASRPDHVCINEMIVMPTAQANTVHWNKR